MSRKLTVDLFAGGGGASSGIEEAGLAVDIAINHDAAAVEMHKMNHPETEHFVSDVFEIDPRLVTRGVPVGLLWASPDCTYHSKARGGKPIRSKLRKRRALAWVVTRWAGQVRPDVIMLENVEEFADWGPLVGPPDQLRPCPKRRGHSFRKWVRSLRRHGYEVEWRELRACDYGAPTIRKRLFLIARCDGRPIVWPRATHGSGLRPFRTAAECIDWSIPMLSIFATKDEAKRWGKEHGQASPIRPLADNTLRRIARGVKRYVLDNPKPFLVTLNHGGEHQRAWDLAEPMRTMTAARDAHAVVAPHVTKFRSGSTGHRADEPLHTVTSNSNDAKHLGGSVPLGVVAASLQTCNNSRDPLYGADEPSHTIVADGARHNLVATNLIHVGNGERDGQLPRAIDAESPLNTIVGSPKHAVVASFLAQNNEGFYKGHGRSLGDPMSTILNEGANQSLVAANLIEQHGTAHAEDIEKGLQTISAGGQHHGLMATHIQREFGQSVGSASDEPVGTVTPNGQGKAALVASFLQKYYGTGGGQLPGEPAHTIPTVDRFGLVTVEIGGETFFIEDIAMRMLQPRELYNAQGFRDGYVIDRGADGRVLTKTEQVRMCGNSVCPPVAMALVQANAAHLIASEELIA